MMKCVLCNSGLMVSTLRPPHCSSLSCASNNSADSRAEWARSLHHLLAERTHTELVLIRDTLTWALSAVASVDSEGTNAEVTAALEALNETLDVVSTQVTATATPEGDS